MVDALEQKEPFRGGLVQQDFEQGPLIQMDGSAHRGSDMCLDRLQRIGGVADIDNPQREVHWLVQHLAGQCMRIEQPDLHRLRVRDGLMQRRLQGIDIERSDDLCQLGHVEARITQIDMLPKEDPQLGGKERRIFHGPVETPKLRNRARNG
ncbi:hypothetical protein AWB78_06865 [Caballeronia calidae]|uniref:Uncharacterized protein n=1 Tax=Caballeronia calidae TaxID=1777139 RepID=A0A158EBH4_9BURK|nr:hypothetical protein AWB78_06865 [Caballeronia calidae]